MSGIDERSGSPILYDEYFTFCQWNQTYAKDPKVVSQTDNIAGSEEDCLKCCAAQ